MAVAAPRKQSPQHRSNSAARVSLPGSGDPTVIASDHFPDGPPPPPEEITHLEAVEAWEAIWAEPQARGFTRADLVILRRYIVAYQEWIGAMASVSASPMVDGSMGQPVQNPLMGWASSREALMEKCEKQLGIGLRNRADLGISVGVAKMTAHQLNEMARKGRSGDADSAPKRRRTKAEIAAARAEAEIIEAFEVE